MNAAFFRLAFTAALNPKLLGPTKRSTVTRGRNRARPPLVAALSKGAAPIPKGTWWFVGHGLSGGLDAAGSCVRCMAQLALCAVKGVAVADEHADSLVDG